jgi:hypothetical protein
MPRKAVDYSKTIIYKIVCNDLTITDLYVGSTTDFIKRKSNHKSICNNLNARSHNLKIYKTIRENGGFQNWSMVQIEEYPCANGNESYARERYWYEQVNANLNMVFPQRDQIEHYIANKDRILDDRKKYCKLNRDKIRDASKKYYENNKDQILAQKKQYYKNKKHINYLNSLKENI